MVVTGATSGIGLATAEILASRGAWVIGASRSEERCAQTERRLYQQYPQARVTYLAADLSLQSGVRRLAEQIRTLIAPTGRLEALVNNAGAFTYWLTLTPEGFETQWAVNHLAPFLLTNELLPVLRAAPAARVVTVSSGSHYSARLNWEDIQLRRRYNGLQAYGQTKLANVLFTLELNARQGGASSLRAFAADPGLVKTDIGFKGTPALVRWIWKIRRSGGITAEESARGVVFLATEAAIQDSPEIYWRHSQPRQASRRALDREAAARLWQISSQMCGI
jgi:NAD(P)-dependent dehydrogenase (short-subunit alcohol dehydrogenase family)